MNFFSIKIGPASGGKFKRKHWVIVSIFIVVVVGIVAYFSYFADKQVQKIRDVVRSSMIPEPFRVKEDGLKEHDKGQVNDQVLSAQRYSTRAADTCQSCAQQKKSAALENEGTHLLKDASIDQALDLAEKKERPFSSIAGLDNPFIKDIFQQVSKEAGWKNINLSPLGISLMMAMAYEGSAGNTAQEIRSVLGYPTEGTDAKAQAHKEFSMLIPSLNDSDQLTCANASWLGQDLPVVPAFKEILNTVYRSEFFHVDFCQSQSATKKINDWCAQKTKGRIKEAIAKTTCSLRLVLVNAIYFKAKWQIPFSKELTEKKTFFVDDNLSVEADMMGIQDKYLYAETPSFQVLEMPYEKDRFSMIAFLPKLKNSKLVLERLGAGQDPQLWQEIMEGLNALRKEEVIIQFPKFEFYNDWENIVDQLKSLGMTTPFTSAADFSGISKEALYISKILQKTFIKVDEESTEAAAVTMGMMESIALPAEPQLPKEFIADHPFVFMIKDNATQSVVFIGQIVDPTKK